jgi:diguanylate cyclase (GGDEF)-like protein
MMAVVMFALIFLVLTGFVVHLNLARRKFRRLANRDLLTGINNRSYGSKFLDTEHARAQRYGRDYALAILDIDHFKRVNDTFGHHVGDEVLKAIANLVKQRVRKSDLFCRWGGEEFVLILPETQKQAAVTLVRSINRLIAETPFRTAGRVTTSIGLATVRAEDATWEEVLTRADARLYEAKTSGRNRVCAVTIEEAELIPAGGDLLAQVEDA